MANAQWRVEEWLTSAGMTLLGIILAAVPVLLWVAWTPLIFTLVLTVAASSAALIIVFNNRQNAGVEDRPDSGVGGPLAGVPANFFEEIHRVFPLTHHHSRKGKAGFRRAMVKIRRLRW